MPDWLRYLPEEAREKLREVAQPDWTDHMLATLTDRRFSDKNWIFERKLDGERCLAFLNGGRVRLMSRNKKELNAQYPEIAEALKGQHLDPMIIDGEIVAFEGNLTSFARLQGRMHVENKQETRQSGIGVYYYVFDLLYFDGYDLTRLGLRQRKTLLKHALSFRDLLRLVPHRNAEGETYFREACRKGWEGIIAKRADSPYIHSRSQDWLKFKCVNSQEFVIGGYTEPHGARAGLGALLVGYYKDDDLIYAGKVGTGFDEDTLRRLSERLRSLEMETPPFVSDDLPTHEVHWVQPKLVAQIGFEEWTDYGKLRQPRFQGLRQDKDPQEVVKEEALS